MSSWFSTAQHWLGISRIPVSHTEKLLAGLGGFVGIALVYSLSAAWLTDSAAQLLIASMGASAVLLFAVPHGPLSQPWPVFGGHVLGATVGVSCALLPLPLALNAALAVGLTIGLMHLLRCPHPPGGATALTAVIGGASVHALGFDFVMIPVALNALTLLVVAVAFNYPLQRRRYPAALAEFTAPPRASIAPAALQHPPPIEHAHLVAALSEIDAYLDISEQDLLRIYELATQFADADAHERPAIVLGGCYSNGRFGADWEVREVTAIHAAPRHRVEFSVVAGANRRHCGSSSLATFQRWAAHQVVRDENSWRPVVPIEE
ncbi:HPP family protein [Chromatium okenii]|uniref:HPP family protein n=1 Tax=Chromatium okenii TaxID=61644 RepID=UPI0026ECB8A6|nr:HPP family protein [Chromatium okenii]MBV5307886.1 HPP family protein [Chromatium okenii]